MKRILPTWCKEVKKSMIDDDINVTELAERVGFSRNYVSGVVNGRVYAPEIAKVTVELFIRSRKENPNANPMSGECISREEIAAGVRIRERSPAWNAYYIPEICRRRGNIRL